MVRTSGHPRAAELRDVARRLTRLTQDWSDPRRFHDRRDSLAEELLAIADGLSTGDRR